MYISAVIKNRAGELITVRATAGGDAIAPLDAAARMKYALATNKLLASYMAKIRPYANKDHAILEVRTDNFMLIDRLSKGFEVHYVPMIPEEGEGDGE